jgi:hypothetical protein
MAGVRSTISGRRRATTMVTHTGQRGAVLDDKATRKLVPGTMSVFVPMTLGPRYRLVRTPSLSRYWWSTPWTCRRTSASAFGGGEGFEKFG